MMGHDVEYSHSKEDSELLTIAREEHRILLTRDFQLYQRAIAKEVDSFYVQGQTEEKRLAELADRLGIELRIDMSNSRCPKCNTLIQPASKSSVEDRVEENTFQHYSDFWRCPNCSQIYWQGAHWTKIRETLEKATETLQRQKRAERLKLRE